MVFESISKWLSYFNGSAVDDGTGSEPPFWNNWDSENRTWIDFFNFKYNLAHLDFGDLSNYAALLFICFSSIFISGILVFIVYKCFFSDTFMKWKSQMDLLEKFLKSNENNVDKKVEGVGENEGNAVKVLTPLKNPLESNELEKTGTEDESVKNLPYQVSKESRCSSMFKRILRMFKVVQDNQLPIEKPDESLKDTNSSRDVDMLEKEKEGIKTESIKSQPNQKPKDEDSQKDQNLPQSDVQVQDKQLPTEKSDESLKDPNSSRRDVNIMENMEKEEVGDYQNQEDQVLKNSMSEEPYFSPAASGDLTFDESMSVSVLHPDFQKIEVEETVDEESPPLNSTQMDDQVCSSGLSEMNKIPFSPFSPLSPDWNVSRVRKMINGETINEKFELTESSFAWYGNESTHNQDPGNVDLIFYQYPRGQNIPCLSSSGLRLESILRMAGIKYQLSTSTELFSVDVKSCPSFLLLDKNEGGVCGLRDCLKLIDVTFAEKIQKFKPSETQRTKVLYLADILDKRLNWGLYLWRSFYEENNEIKENEKIWSSGLFEDQDSKAGQGFIQSSLGLEHGFGKEELIKVVNNDLKNISDLLGKNKFFGGKNITEIDCLLFSTLTQFSSEDLSSTGGGDSETKTSIIQEYGNLYKFCVRVQELLWPDWKWKWMNTGNKMDEDVILIESEAMKTPASSVQYGMKLRSPKSMNGQGQVQDEEKPDQSSSRRRRYNQSLNINVQQSPVRSNVKGSKSKLLTPVIRK